MPPYGLHAETSGSVRRQIDKGRWRKMTSLCTPPTLVDAVGQNVAPVSLMLLLAISGFTLYLRIDRPFLQRMKTMARLCWIALQSLLALCLLSFIVIGFIWENAIQQWEDNLLSTNSLENHSCNLLSVTARSSSIRASVFDLIVTFALGMGLVILVSLVFRRLQKANE